MKKITVLIMMLLIYIPSHGAGFSTFDDAEKKFAEAMSHIDKLDIEKGITVLKPYWPLPEVEIDAVIHQTEQQLPLMKERYGEPIGSEKVCMQSIGDSWKRITYLQKFEKHTLVWKADFYKPKSEWLINTVSFHDRWQTLFEKNCSNK